jgi:pimeloyl-ACP methyl ester carboxylesterase
MEQLVRVNDIQLHCLDYPDGPRTLLLIPGMTSNASVFQGLIEAGLRSTLRVLAVDLRGRGLSDKPRSGYGMADYAVDVLGLLDALELQQVVLGGHSYGGVVAMYMAAHYPDRISKLVLIDAAAWVPSNGLQQIQAAVDRLGKVWPSWEAYLEAMKQMPFYQGWWDPTIEAYYRADVEIRADGTVKPRTLPEAIIESEEKGQIENWEEHLAAVKQPILLLNALDSFGPPGAPPMLPRERAMETVNAAANGRYVEVPGNHMTMLFGEGAQRIVESIREFVREWPRVAHCVS